MTAIAPDAQVSSTDAAHLAGVSYRQLNYVAIHLGWTPGTGTRRRWSYDQIHRLRIAAALNEEAHRRDFLHFAIVVLHGPQPPDSGWAAYTSDEVAYGSSPAVALKGLTGAVIAKIPELGR